MALTSMKFCGLSVIGVRTSLGWGGAGSRLQVDLVAAPEDAPLVPPVGTPVFVQLNAFRFGGILQNFTKTVDAQGGEVYQAYCVDPREILRNVGVILGGYNGAVAVPNLINAYGSQEALGGFGSAGVTGAGMPWLAARAAILRVASTPGGTPFGGPFEYQGYAYGLDLSAVPNPPADYRVGPGVVNLLDLVEQVVRDLGRDYWVDLVGTTIVVRTTNRGTQAPLGLIEALVESAKTSGTLVGGQYGQEDAVGEPASAFLFGGPQVSLYETDGLKNFWGYRPDGSTVVGDTGYSFWSAYWTDEDDNETKLSFDLPPPALSKTKPQKKLTVKPGVEVNLFPVLSPEFYMDWAEVSAGHERVNLSALPVADVIGAAEYDCSTLEMRFALAGVDSWIQFVESCKSDLYKRLHAADDRFPQVLGIRHNVDFLADARNRVVNDALAVAEQGMNSWRERLYQFVRGYAENFYGVQWLAPLPFVSTAVDADTLHHVYSAEPASAGWAEEGSNPLGLDTIHEPLFTDSQGRFYPFAAFDADGADLSGAGGTSDGVFESDTFYSRCQVSDGVVFYESNPYALVQAEAFTDQKADALGGAEELAAVQMATKSRFVVEQIFQTLPLGIAPARRTPLGAAVPLASNTLCYGPWQSTLGSGLTDARQDQGLVPWNYGSTAAMNLAAVAMVNSVPTGTRVADTGELRVVGLPQISLGDALEVGPLVTDIAIEYGVRGVTTTYRWKTYTPRPGVAAKQFVDRVRKDSLLGVAARRTALAATRDAIRNREQFQKGRAGKRFNDGVVKALKKETPHDVLVARATQDPDGRVRNQVASVPAHEALAMIGAHDDAVFRSTALMTLNGLLRPITTNPSGSYPLSKYPRPTGVPYGVTATTLNPYASGNDVDALAYGQTYGGVKSFRTGGAPDDCRPVAVRSPMVMTGWGRTIRGEETNPPPSGLARPDQHKTGPLDALWDEDRGTWSVHDAAIGYVEGRIHPGGSGLFSLWDGRADLSYDLAVWNWSDNIIDDGSPAVAVYDPRSDRWWAIPDRVTLKDISVCPTYVSGVVTSITVSKEYTDGTVVCETDPTDCCDVSYNCVDGDCQQIAGTGGAYATLGACQAGCIDPGETLSCGGEDWPMRLCLTFASGANTEDVGTVTTVADGEVVGDDIEWTFYTVLKPAVDGTYDGGALYATGKIVAPCDPGDWATGASGSPYITGSHNYRNAEDVFGNPYTTGALGYMGNYGGVSQTTTTATPDPLSVAATWGAYVVTAVPFTGECTPDGPTSFDCVDGGCVQVAGEDGAYATLEACEADSCVECCEEAERPATLCGYWTNQTGDCDCLETLALTREGTAAWAVGNGIGCDSPVAVGGVFLSCLDDVWQFPGSGGMTTALVSASCDPFLVVFDVTFTTGGCGDGGSGTARITFMEGPCPETSFDCVSNVCVDPLDGSGEFATLAACEAGCEAPETWCDTYTTDYGLLGTTTIALVGPGHWSGTTPSPHFHTLEMFAPGVDRANWVVRLNTDTEVSEAPSTWDGSGCQEFECVEGVCEGLEFTFDVCCVSPPPPCAYAGSCTNYFVMNSVDFETVTETTPGTVWEGGTTATYTLTRTGECTWTLADNSGNTWAAAEWDGTGTGYFDPTNPGAESLGQTEVWCDF